MARPIQLQDLLAFRLPGDVQVTAQGDRIAYVLKSINREKNQYETAIYVVGPNRQPVQFTAGDSDSSPRFSPDGAALAFVSRRSGQPQIWVMSVHGGEARQLTKLQGGVGSFAWAPDGSTVAFVAMLDERGVQPEVKEEPEDDLFKKHTKNVKVITEQFHKLDGVGYFGDRRPCLCVTTYGDDPQVTQLTKPPYRIDEFTWAPDGQNLVIGSRMGDGYDREAFVQQLYVVSVHGGNARELTTTNLVASGPAVSPDGKTVAFLAGDPKDFGYDNETICLIPIEGGPVRRVVQNWDRPFGNVGVTDMPAPGGGRLTWSLDGKSIFGVCSIGGTTQIVRTDLEAGTVVPATSGDRLIYSFALTRDCSKVVLGIADPLNPGDVYWQDFTAGTEDRLTCVNESLLEDLELSRPERFTAQAEGGPQVDAWIVKPTRITAGKRYPTVLSIHGGPMAMYAAGFFFEFQLLAAQGFGVVYSNPRGSLGYGEAFCKAIQYEWGNKDYQDVMAVLDEAIATNSWIDTERLGVTGGSYGGYMTNWIVSHTDRFKAAVTGRSICDWRVMVGTGDGGPDWIRRATGNPPWIDDTWYKQQSPITYVNNVVTPILIEHQEGDLRCPIDQGMMWYSAIKYLNKAPVRFVTYPNEFHGMNRDGKPWHRIHRLHEISTWFTQYLKPE